MGTRKTCRAVANLTDEQDTAFGIAVERAQSEESDRVGRQRILLGLIAKFCRDHGVKFPAATAPKTRKRPPAAPQV